MLKCVGKKTTINTRQSIVKCSSLEGDNEGVRSIERFGAVIFSIDTYVKVDTILKGSMSLKNGVVK